MPATFQSTGTSGVLQVPEGLEPQTPPGRSGTSFQLWSVTRGKTGRNYTMEMGRCHGSGLPPGAVVPRSAGMGWAFGSHLLNAGFSPHSWGRHQAQSPHEEGPAADPALPPGHPLMWGPERVLHQSGAFQAEEGDEGLPCGTTDQPVQRAEPRILLKNRPDLVSPVWKSASFSKTQ